MKKLLIYIPLSVFFFCILFVASLFINQTISAATCGAGTYSPAGNCQSSCGSGKRTASEFNEQCTATGLTQCCVSQNQFKDCATAGGTCRPNCDNSSRNEVGLAGLTSCNNNWVDKSCCVKKPSTPRATRSVCLDYEQKDSGTGNAYCISYHGNENAYCTADPNQATNSNTGCYVPPKIPTPAPQPTDDKSACQKGAEVVGMSLLWGDAYCKFFHADVNSVCGDSPNQWTDPDGCYNPGESLETTPAPAIGNTCNGIIEGTFDGKRQNLEFKCQDTCSGEYKNETSNQERKDACKPKKCCFKPISASVATATPTPRNTNPGPARPTPTATAKSNQPTQTPQSCPRSGDSCYYMEGDKCYSGHGASGINQEKCVYSCGPIDSSKCKEAAKEAKRESAKDEPALNCTPGEPVDDCSNAKCPDNKDKKCQGHKYCVWDDDGTNYASACICEVSEPYCSDDDNKQSGGGSCKDNPTDPPDGYTWKNSCKACSNNSDCPRNTKDGAVNPDSSNWCFNGSCLMLVTKGGTSQDTKKEEDRKKKEEDKRRKEKKEADKKKKADKEKKIQSEKTAEEKEKQAQKKGKTTTPTLKPGQPTSTPEANLTPSTTPVPPLPEPKNWQGFCGQTTDPTRPWGIRVSWDGVEGAPRYAVRIDEDAPSWEGDTPSVGDTVDNQVKDTAYTREAKQGAVYQWWVHSVNASGIYSGLTKKLIIKCPEKSTTGGTPIPQTVGAGQLIVLPLSSTAVPPKLPQGSMKFNPNPPLNGVAGKPYPTTASQAITAIDENGRQVAPAQTDFQITQGSLPPGVQINETTDSIGGTPAAPGTYTFTITGSRQAVEGTQTVKQSFGTLTATIVIVGQGTPIPTPQR